MKKTFFILGFVTFSVVTFLNARNQGHFIGFMNVGSVEIMSRGEMDNGHWLEPQTVRCKLDFPDGSFTSSVERVCVMANYMSNCMGVRCGEPF